jgi:hypothetical protein
MVSGCQEHKHLQGNHEMCQFQANEATVKEEKCGFFLVECTLLTNFAFPFYNAIISN